MEKTVIEPVAFAPPAEAAPDSEQDYEDTYVGLPSADQPEAIDEYALPPQPEAPSDQSEAIDEYAPPPIPEEPQYERQETPEPQAPYYHEPAIEPPHAAQPQPPEDLEDFEDIEDIELPFEPPPVAPTVQQHAEPEERQPPPRPAPTAGPAAPGHAAAALPHTWQPPPAEPQIEIPALRDSPPHPPVQQQASDRTEPPASDSWSILGDGQETAPGPAWPMEEDVTRPASPEPAATRAAQPHEPSPDAQTRAIENAMPKELDLSGRAIGGYRVKKMLGAGGMGAVALARQVSLDRDVALKILPVQFAKHPELLARFTREALSAAQLTHHNIVQVHDVGCEGDIHFFSMEFVRGQTLSDMVRKQGRLSPEEAASLILQAARGLKYAHDRGLVHRDIKPDNILVDEHGIVKIADMGLAKFRQDVEQTLGSSSATTADVLAAARGDITMANIAMGTPAYMSPEQAKDASSVDHRADQYSLGCTLYYLIAGAAPYGGSTAREIITKHQQDPLLPLDKRVRNIPPALNAVVSRMLEKRPEDRYADMAELIRNLEFVLGVHSQQAYYTPREQELQQLEDQLNGYYFGCPSARRRQMAVRLFFLSTITALLGADLTGQFALAGGFFGLLVMAPVFNFIFDGIAHKTYVFRRLKSTLSGMRLKSTTLLLLVVAALGALLHYCGFLVHWGVFAAVAVALAAFYQFRMVRGLHRERAGVLNKARNMLKHLRLKGTPEEHIRDFVCRFSGDDWEEFFEDLFGYQAMIEARNKWVLTDATAQRRRYAPWRDALVRWCDKIETKRRTLRDKRHLAKVEAKRLRAQGASALDAKRKAEAAASQILADIKIANRIAQGETETIAAAPRPVLPRRSIFSLAFSFLRFVLGVFICAMFLSHWFGQMLPPALKPYLDRLSALPIPPEILKVLHGYFAPAVGGALIVSSLSSRFLAGLLVVIGAALMLAINYLLPMILGRHHLITETAYIHASLGFMIGGILLALISRLFTGRF